MDIYEQALQVHKQTKGKIFTGLRGEVNKESLRLYYSPGVGGVSLYTQDSPEKLKEVSWVNNLVAIISDGTAVLGLGNIGPEAQCLSWRAKLCYSSILPTSMRFQLF